MHIEIPYNVRPRPDTGLYNAKLGIWLFLASEVMLFGALFSSLILLRSGVPHWPHGRDEGLNIPLATVNTLVLIISSVTVVLAWANLRLGDLKKGRIFLGATLLCACGFMVIKAIEYTDKFKLGHFPKTNNFYAIYFTLTGLHGLHVLGERNGQSAERERGHERRTARLGVPRYRVDRGAVECPAAEDGRRVRRSRH